MARVMRFTAAAIPTVLTLDRSEREALKRREAATSSGNRTATSRHCSTPPLHLYSDGLRRLQRRHGSWQRRVPARFFSTVKGFNPLIYS